jgi:hypothetical protein
VVRLTTATCALGALLLGIAGCGASTPATPRAQLRVVAEPPGASVYVDDRFVATARRLARRPEPLPPGVHYVTISAQGYFPHDLEMDLPQGVTTVNIRLRAIPP